MLLSEAKEKLVKLLADGLQNGLHRATSSLPDETLYAVLLHAASGFQAISIAVNTMQRLEKLRKKGQGLPDDILKMLEDHPDLLTKAESAYSPDPEVHADEWELIYNDLPDSQTEDLVDCLHKHFGDIGMSNESISQWFQIAVRDAVQAFARSLEPDSDLMLGVCFSDPNCADLDVTEQISKHVNSDSWHSKIERECLNMKSNA